MNPGTWQQVTTRNDMARDIIAGFASAAPTLAGVFQFIDSALAEAPALLAELQRSQAELKELWNFHGTQRTGRAATTRTVLGRGMMPYGQQPQ